MDSAPLAERIGPLLHQMPRDCGLDCDAEWDGHGKALITHSAACWERYESRLAQAVADAIEACAEIGHGNSRIEAKRVEAALRALAEPQ